MRKMIAMIAPITSKNEVLRQTVRFQSRRSSSPAAAA